MERLPRVADSAAPTRSKRRSHDEELFSPRGTHKVVTPYSGDRDSSALEGSEHRVYRALVSGPFKRDAVERLTEQTIRPTVEELVDDLPRGETVDLVPTLCKLLPLTIIQRMLGIPPDPRLDHWADTFINTHQDPAASGRAAIEFTELLAPVSSASRNPTRARAWSRSAFASRAPSCRCRASRRHDGEFRGAPIAAGSFSLLCLGPRTANPMSTSTPTTSCPTAGSPGRRPRRC